MTDDNDTPDQKPQPSCATCRYFAGPVRGVRGECRRRLGHPFAGAAGATGYGWTRSDHLCREYEGAP